MLKQIGYLRWLWLSGIIIIIDQISKLAVSVHLPLSGPVKVTAFFNIILAHNQGIAFSILNDSSGWQRWLLASLAFIIIIALIVWLIRLPQHQTWLALALAFIIGGACGNLLDRIRLGYVVDFLDFYLAQWHWPAFNVADSAVFIGACLLCTSMFLGKKLS
ncbi:MAG: signal peptidase II [Gammaproteobacteria bacterium]|nr:signal peptidase II [Gammaproteobacteria bacterium]